MGGKIEKSKYEGQGVYTIQKLGDTPEDAVRELYLELHGK